MSHRPPRMAILDTMHAIVRGHGWAATSVGRLAEQAGFSRQTLYNEFGSRPGLVHAYVMYRLDALMCAIEETFSKDGDIEMALRASLKLFFDTFDPAIIDLVAANGAEAEDLIPILRDTNEEATHRLAAIICQALPAIEQPDALVYADTVARLALTHALAPTMDRSEAIDRITQVAVRALGTR